MAKTETISWRINSDIRMALEAEARVQGVTLAEILNRIAKQWLETRKQRRGAPTQAREAWVGHSASKRAK